MYCYEHISLAANAVWPRTRPSTSAGRSSERANQIIFMKTCMYHNVTV